MGGIQQADEVRLAEPFRLAFTPPIQQRAVDQPAPLAGPVTAQPRHRHPDGAFGGQLDDRGDTLRRPAGGLVAPNVWPHWSATQIHAPRRAAIFLPPATDSGASARSP